MSTVTSSDKVKSLVAAMLKENTGRALTEALTDSGDYCGRMRQRNQDVDFEALPAVTGEVSYYRPKDKDTIYEPIYTISVYHFLTAHLDVDDLCEEFNSLPVLDWDSDFFYGVSSNGEAWLTSHEAKLHGECVNTYNAESNLSQILQYRRVKMVSSDRTLEDYVLLQVHGGCDARCGYTNAKLFRFKDDEAKEAFCSQRANVTISIANPNEETVYFDSYYPGSEWVTMGGQCIRGEDLPLNADSKVEFSVDFNS